MMTNDLQMFLIGISPDVIFIFPAPARIPLLQTGETGSGLQAH
jgi:hypothetical protein